MKSIYFLFFGLFIILSCTADVKEFATQNYEDKITFIGNYENPDTEVVIKKMIRHSVLEDEYTILSNSDTITFNSIGRTFFKVGLRTTVLDSVLVEKGDVITVSLHKDSLQIKSNKNDLTVNLQWLNNYQNKVEDSYEALYEPIQYTSADLDFLRMPLHIFNDYETQEFTMSHIYAIDRMAYKQNKLKFDEKLRGKYLEFDSLINIADIDPGSKQILRYTLFNSTLDKFRRVGSTLQNWMYENMNQNFENDCGYKMNTIMTEFYLNYLSGKHFQKITYLDLQKAFQSADEILCPEFLLEIKRVCLQKMFLNGNKPKETIDLLRKYITQHKDSTFYQLMEEQFVIGNSDLNGKGIESSFINKYNQKYDYDELIKESKGNVVLVDFWASWCAPCRKGMPDVKELEQKYAAENFKVIYVSIDQYPNKWKKAAKDEGIWERNNYWANNFHDSEIYNRFNLTHIPRYIIYDKYGKVAYQKAPKPDAMEDIITDLLKK